MPLGFIVVKVKVAALADPALPSKEANRLWRKDTPGAKYKPVLTQSAGLNPDIEPTACNKPMSIIAMAW